MYYFHQIKSNLLYTFGLYNERRESETQRKYQLTINKEILFKIVAKHERMKTDLIITH